MRRMGLADSGKPLKVFLIVAGLEQYFYKVKLKVKDRRWT